MIRRSDITVLPDGVTPEPGIYITVKTSTGALATLFTDAGLPLANPFVSDSNGGFAYNILDSAAGSYFEEYRTWPTSAPKILAVLLDADSEGNAAVYAFGQLPIYGMDSLPALTLGKQIYVTDGVKEAGGAGVVAYADATEWRRVSDDQQVFTFDPATLFTASKKGAWWDVSDLSTMRQGSTIGSAAAAVDSQVGYIGDKSGNGNHFLQTDPAAQPYLRQDPLTGAYYLEHTGPEFFSTAATMTFTANMDFYFAAETLLETALGSSNFIALFNTAMGGSWLGYCIDSTAVGAGNSDAPSLAVDGIATGGTTGASIRTLFGTGEPHVMEVRNSNPTHWPVAQVQYGYYFPTIKLMGRFYGAILCEAQSASRGFARSYLARKSGRNIARPVSIIAMGDSTIAAYAGNNSVLSYVATSHIRHTQAVPGDTIAGQRRDMNVSSWVLTAAAIVVEVGLNDLNPAEAASVAIARLQGLITDAKSRAPRTCPVLIAQMTPCRARLLSLYGATDGPVAYQKWLDINTAIGGGGSTPITNVDARITSHVALLNDGSGNLAAAYDSGDHIHPTNAGRQITAAAWQTALTALGVA